MSNTSLERGNNSQEATASVLIEELDLIDAKSMYALRLVFMYILQLLIQTLGIGANVVTIITYVKSGMTDSVSVCFLSLAFSDTGYLVVFMAVRIIGMLHAVVKIATDLPLPVFAYVISFYGVYFQDVSTFITLYTAVQKCCCVSLPHLFKNLFTTSRSWIVNVVIYVAILAVYVPIFHSIGFRYAFSVRTNATYLIPYTRFYFASVMDFWRIFSRILLVISTQVILFICLTIMVIRFKQSAQFRESFANDENGAANSDEKQGGKKSAKLGLKERRALAAVVWVSAMYMFSTIPYTVVYFVTLTYPPYKAKHLTNLRTLVSNSQSIFIALSASLNFFVYLKYNSKFRLTFQTIFNLRLSPAFIKNLLSSRTTNKGCRLNCEENEQGIAYVP